MEKFDDLTHANEPSLQFDIEGYMSGNLGDDADNPNGGTENRMDIIHLFGKEKLENIQTSLSKATGLAFITVNYRGDPITEPTYFSRFCQYVRNFPNTMERCKASDAFGSIQAAVTQKTNVYFCPCGLLEVAIPIIVRGHYLGGFIGGQIRCTDAPESVSRLASVMHTTPTEKTAEYDALYQQVPIYSFEKFMDVANLVFLVINQLSENEINQHMQEDLLNKRIKKMLKSNQRYLKEISQKNLQLQEYQIQSDPYFLLDAIGSLLNLTVIEDAPRTNEMLSVLTDFIRYNCLNLETFVHLSMELEHAEQYLFFKKSKLGDQLAYSMQIPKELQMRRIPSKVLMPFIQNALYNGVMLKKEGGKISVTGYTQNDHIIIEINDTGLGLTPEELELRFEAYRDFHEGYYIKLGMDYARDKMRRLFGDSCDIVMENHRNKGSRCILRWPEQLEVKVEEPCTES